MHPGMSSVGVSVSEGTRKRPHTPTKVVVGPVSKRGDEVIVTWSVVGDPMTFSTDGPVRSGPCRRIPFHLAGHWSGSFVYEQDRNKPPVKLSVLGVFS